MRKNSPQRFLFVRLACLIVEVTLFLLTKNTLLSSIFRARRALLVFFSFYLLHSDKLKGSERYFDPQIFCQYDENARPEHLEVVDRQTQKSLGWIDVSYEPEFSLKTSEGFVWNREEHVSKTKDLSSSQAKSDLYQVPGKSLEQGGISFINGIYTTLEQAGEHAKKISGYAKGYLISYVHNATQSFLADVSECFLGYFHVISPPVLLLMQQWEDFIRTHGPHAKFLQIAHSQGALHVRNALFLVSEEVRSHIIVLAIAPAALIPPELCYAAYHYVSKNDFVPYLDVMGSRYYKEQLTLLDPHPKANYWDHDFDSPTFEEILERTIETYLASCEE